MSVLNLVKDKKYVFNKVVQDVEFYYWDTPNFGELAGVAGHMSKADVKIEINPRQTDLVNGQKLQLGYDMSVTITSQQLYSAFEFDKLQNRLCMVKIIGVSMWIMPVLLNIAVNFVPGESQGVVTITASKFGATLLECISPTWDGQITDPWALPINPVPDSELPATGFQSEYTLRADDPNFTWITPPTPTEGVDITEFKVLMLQLYGEPLEKIPTGTTLEKFDGLVWTAVAAGDFDVVYEGGFYYVHYSSLVPMRLKDKIRISYT